MAVDASPQVTARVAALERARGVEVVTASIAKADVYPELPWRAGALAASMTALVVAIGDVLRPDWVTSTTLLVSLATVMIVGAGVSLVTIFMAPFARLFLSKARVQVEVRQFAHAFFLERQLFRTHKRQGILILVARFEHRVEIVADIGFDGRIAAAEWGSVIPPMVPLLRDGRADDALIAGLDALDALLASRGFAGDGHLSNELPDATMHEDEGDR
ncbi:MAG: TPM domain-containing protein [Betaproteobacteria bacterium]